jgi:hypothetical protein
MALSRIRVLSSPSPTVLAPRPVWGPRYGHLCAQVDATPTRDKFSPPSQVTQGAIRASQKLGTHQPRDVNKRACMDHLKRVPASSEGPLE